MAQICLRIDDDVKSSAEQVCEEIGLSMSAAINIYLKKIGREKRIPFTLTADPFYSEENMRKLDTAIADARAGRNMTEHELYEVE